MNRTSQPAGNELAEVASHVTDRRGAGAELDALRRVATLVAQRVQPEEVFAVVAEEIAGLVAIPLVRVVRYESDGTATQCAAFSTDDSGFPFKRRSPLEGASVLQLVRETSKAARIDDYSGLEGEIAEIARRSGIRSAVGAPIVLAGRLWGAVVASSKEQLPEGTEARLADFTELLATAIENAESREALERLLAEQAALRRVATLVAHGVRPDELFAAVSDEVGRLFGTDSATVVKYDDEGAGIVFVGVASRVSGAFPLGAHWLFQEGMASAEVYRTGGSARTGAHLSTVEGPIGDIQRRLGIMSAVASPIVVEGRLWGAMAVHGREPLPSGTEERLEKFTELVATAISNAESREALARLADEQAALRRVATLVAQGVRPVEIFSAVAEEVGRLVSIDGTMILRYGADGAATMLAGWSSLAEVPPELEVGARQSAEGKSVSAQVFLTGRPARIDSYANATGVMSKALHETGVRSAVGAPIVVEGRLWGVVAAGSTKAEPLPSGMEFRLAEFTELLATAIANAESRAELTASRARIVAASDDARRRIERDLHDGAQQRLVSLGLQIRIAQKRVPSEITGLRDELFGVAKELENVLDDLREMSRGIHPASLTEGGLAPALRTLARRSAIPVEVEVHTEARLPEQIEVAAYYVASEALTNAAKHAQASVVRVVVEKRDDIFHLSIRDDGVGGADQGRGTGLIGLRDRVEAVGGSIKVSSPLREGTLITVELPT